MNTPKSQEELLDDKYEESFQEEDHFQHPPEDIISYNELRSCAELYRWCTKGQLNVQPDFQREDVWGTAKMTRFIDSLMAKLPIPSMCIAYDFKKEKMTVIDGLQRITSITKFLNPESKIKLTRLDDVSKTLSGKKVSALHKNEDLISRIENVSIPITILRCDLNKKSHQEYMYTIFHRLNTGGMSLNNQEIRNCIYSGSLNQLLKSLDSDKNWLRLFNLEEPKQDRFKRKEQILRFLALHFRAAQYEGKLSKFLNDFMSDNMNADESDIEHFSNLFKETIDVVAQLSDYPKAIVYREAFLHGISSNLEGIKSKQDFNVDLAFKKMLQTPEFSTEELQEGLSSKDKLKGRMKAAREAIKACLE